MGILDWDDIESMIDEAVAQKITDPDRLGIAGVSQGGFLAAWGCTRPNSRFKAGVVGAGPTEWGSLSMCDDMPDLTVSVHSHVAPLNLPTVRFVRFVLPEALRGHSGNLSISDRAQLDVFIMCKSRS